jgi:hypothetical protein
MKSFIGVAVVAGLTVPGAQAGLLDLGYQLVNGNSDKCLTVTAGGLADNAILIQKECERDSSFRWRFERVDGEYRIVNVKSGKCLAIAGDSREDNGFAVQNTCGAALADRWQVRDRSGLSLSDVLLANANSEKCLTIAGGSVTENGVAVQYNCDEESSRRWSARLIAL